MHPHHRITLILIANTSALLFPKTALADVPLPQRNAAGADISALTEIIVTAQRRQENEQDVPVSVITVGGEKLHRQHITDIVALAAQVPGFTIARSLRGPPIFTLRGIGFNSQNISATSPVGVYLDEMAMPYPVMAEGMLFDLERVEILKGPQGTLFGRNTTGGLVNSIAAKPTRNKEGYLTLSGGSYDSYGAEGAISGPLSQTLSARLAFSLERADKGWQKSISRGDRLGQKDRLASRLTLRWEPSAATELTLTGNWWRDRSDTQAPQSVEMYPQGAVALGIAPEDWPAAIASLHLPTNFLNQAFNPTNASQANWTASQLPWGGTVGGHNYTPAPLGFHKDNEFASLALRGEFRLNDHLQLQTLSSYAHLHLDAVADNSGWAFENIIGHALGKIEALSQEVRLAGNHDRFKWVLGTIYSADTVDDTDQIWGGTNTLLQVFRAAAFQYAVAGGADAATRQDVLFGFRDFENSTHQSSRSMAIYGQTEYRPDSAVGLTFGLRYTRDRTRFSGCSRDMGDNSLAATVNAYFNGLGIPASVAPGGCTTFLADLSQGLVRDRLAESNLSGRMALDWHITPGTMLYASAARGYKSGTFPNIEGNFAIQYEPARQEEVWSFETGIKSRPTPWLTLDAAAFYSDYRNKQMFGGVEDPVFGSLTRVLNVPRSHIYGFEASASAKPAKRLKLDASLAYIRTRIDDFTGLDDFGATHDFRGASFVYTPRFQFTSRVEQGFALTAGWEGLVGLSFRHSSAQQADLLRDPRFRLKAYQVLDASLSLLSPRKDYELGLFIKNLTNSYYWTAVHLQSDSFERFAAMPRTWGLMLTRNF